MLVLRQAMLQKRFDDVVNKVVEQEVASLIHRSISHHPSVDFHGVATRMLQNTAHHATSKAVADKASAVIEQLVDNESAEGKGQCFDYFLDDAVPMSR